MRRGQSRVWLPSFLYRGGVGCFLGGAFGGVFCGWWHVLCQVGRCGRFCVRLMGVIMSVLFYGVVFYLLI